MKLLLVFIFASLVFIDSSFAVQDGKTLYKKCRGCHGIDGKYVPFERKNGVLAGRDKEEIVLIIKAIKDGKYPDSKLINIMKRTMVNFSEEDILSISEYISKFKK
jgi:cytochrome c553